MLSRQELTVIQRLLKTEKREVKAGTVWNRLHQTLGIGRPGPKGTISFSEKEIETLRARANLEVPGDIRHANLSGSRTDIAADFTNEKVSTRSVFGHFIWVGRTKPGLIPLACGQAGLAPKGSYLAVDPADIVLRDNDPIILVENGDTFLRRDQVLVPDELKSALWVYRGHNTIAKAVLRFIQEEKRRRPVVGFFDYDPAGVDIAIQTDLDSVLLPVGWQLPMADSPLQKWFKAAEFAKQAPHLQARLKGLSGGRLTLASRVLDGAWSLSQEHMTIHQAPLEVFQVPL